MTSAKQTRDDIAGRLVLVPFNQQESMSLRAASRFAGRSESTMRNWCEAHGLGRRIGGVWCVSRIALAMFLDGDHFALSVYHSGEISSDYISPYYARFGLKAQAPQSPQIPQSQRA